MCSFATLNICIYLAIWLLWLPRGTRILFVYSDSPIWHDYIEQHILPLIQEHAVVLNWSQRRSRSWRRSLAVAAFKHFGGWREFNPMDASIPSQGQDGLPLVDGDVPAAVRRVRNVGYHREGFCICAALSVFAISMAMVIGPTPPGTGVIHPAFLATAV